MTLAQVQTIRDSLIAQMTSLNLNTMDHSIGGASYSPDGHMKAIQEQIAYWDNLYNLKLNAGRQIRECKKAV